MDTLLIDRANPETWPYFGFGVQRTAWARMCRSSTPFRLIYGKKENLMGYYLPRKLDPITHPDRHIVDGCVRITTNMEGARKFLKENPDATCAITHSKTNEMLGYFISLTDFPVIKKRLLAYK